MLKMKSPLIFLFLLPWTCVAQSPSPNFIAVFESAEMGLESDLAANFSRIEQSMGTTVNIKSLAFQRKDSLTVNENLCSELLKTRTTAVLDMSWGGWIRGRNTADEIGLPFLRVQTSNHPHIQAVADFFKLNQVADAVFIFDSKEKLDQCMYYIIMYSDLRITGAWLESSDSLNKIRDMKPRPANIVIFGSKDNIIKSLIELENREMIRRDSYINLVLTDMSEAESTMAVVSPFFPKNINSTLFTINQSTCCDLVLKSEPNCVCDDLTRLFLTAAGEVSAKSAAVIYSDPNSVVSDNWICGSNPVAGVTQRFNKEVKAQAGSRSLDYVVDRRGVGLLSPPLSLQVNQIISGMKKLQKLGDWKISGGFTAAPGYKAANMRRFFRVGLVVGKPWAWIDGVEQAKETKPQYIVSKDKNKGLVGYTMDLLDELSKGMNFDYEIVIATNNGYGSRSAEGEWDGIMGDLIRGDIDISLASMIMTTEREEFIDFVTPYFDQSGISILLREKKVERNIFKFLLVLQDEVWLGILGSVVLVIVLLWILDRWSPYSYVNNREAYPEGAREFTFGECVWFGLTSLTPQGGGECPKSLSARVLVAAYWLFIVLMLATFTANLAALLTVERMQTTVQSLEELARQSQVNYSVVEGSNTMEYFKNMAGAEDELYKKWKELTLNSSAESTKYRVWDYPIREQYTHIYDVIKMVGTVKTPEEGYQRVRDNTNGQFAFIHDASEVKYQYYTNCEFLEIGEQFAEQPLAVAVQEGSSLAKELSQEILSLQKDRFFERVHAKFFDIGQRSSCPVTNDNQGITLESLGGIFLTSLVGLVLSIIMLGYEIWQENNQDKVSPNLFEGPEKQSPFKSNTNIRTISSRSESQMYGGNFSSSRNRSRNLIHVQD